MRTLFLSIQLLLGSALLLWSDIIVPAVPDDGAPVHHEVRGLSPRPQMARNGLEHQRNSPPLSSPSASGFLQSTSSPEPEPFSSGHMPDSSIHDAGVWSPVASWALVPDPQLLTPQLGPPTTGVSVSPADRLLSKTGGKAVTEEPQIVSLAVLCFVIMLLHARLALGGSSQQRSTSAWPRRTP